MKVNNLQQGMTFKNYKELCKVLEIEPTTGNARKAQFKELDRYCKYHKEGNKIIISEIFSEVKTKMDNRTDGNNNNRAKAIRYLLVNLLSNYKNDYGTVAFSKYQLLKRLDLINDNNYKTAKLNRIEYANALDVSEFAVNECMELIDNYSINAIKKAIETLRRNSTLLYKYSYSYVLKVYNEKTKKHERQTYCCNEIEEKIILEAEKNAMEQMNIRSKKAIYDFGRWDEFKYKVKEELKEYSMFKHLDYYYNSFHFTFTEKTIELELNNLHKKGMTYELANELLKEFWVDRLDNTIDDRYKNNVKKKGFGETLDDALNKKNMFRVSNEYKSDMKKVKNSITDINHEEVKTQQITFYDFNNISDIPF